jgi:chromosomal replication initiation ATPase DnaA
MLRVTVHGGVGEGKTILKQAITQALEQLGIEVTVDREEFRQDIELAIKGNHEFHLMKKVRITEVHR